MRAPSPWNQPSRFEAQFIRKWGGVRSSFRIGAIRRRVSRPRQCEDAPASGTKTTLV
ncbi:hypothetical protein RESH_04914 [Rhodopirellula europaea SH398]|uniref:Uncharacterized protein n=1 Tax=Rhodopirellula europaea SH398 TaxID=1263868 RepID=M5RYW0_9BACT|nr:hypothetical protein RESH_04914 [Rhodopirellula europaea SH398]